MSPRERRRNSPAAADRSFRSDRREKKRSILSLLIIAAGLLIFLSLISFDQADEAGADLGAGDILGVFTGDATKQARAETARNWLGLVGAIVAHHLILGTFGYSILFFPLLLITIGWMLLRKDDFGKMIGPFSYVIAGALLASITCGMMRVLFGPDLMGMQWSGVVGDFVAVTLSQLIGQVGGTLLLLTCILVFLVLVTDLDIRKTVDRTKHMLLRVADWTLRRWESWQYRRASRSQQGDDDQRESRDVTVRPAYSEQEEVEPDAAGTEDRYPEVIPPVTRRFEADLEIGKMKVEEEPVQEEGATKVLADEEIDYVFPSVDLLETPRASRGEVDEEELKANADLLRETLAEFDVEVDSVSVTPGPVVTLYELVPAAGVKISRIVSLENDIALKLAAKGIRIMAPIPGRSAVGVEIPNHHRVIVSIRSVINSSRFRDTDATLPLGLGKTISGEVFTDDLARMPHLLIAGSTGSGKSVGINTILASLLYRLHPSELKLVIIDPKKIEMSQYSGLRHHFLAISPDINEEIVTNPKNAVIALKGVEFEMEKRYERFSAAAVRNIVDYNERVKSGRLKNSETIVHGKMPYLVVLIDELADLMITAAREVEEPIARLAQMARAVGIHLVVATQRPSVDVITGVIKANFSARIAFQVASKTDSRTILDANGAEQLLGNGDMLYSQGGTKPLRLQNALITPEEVDAIVDHIQRQKGYAQPFMLPSIAERKQTGSGPGGGDRDELFEEAARLIVRHQQGSVSLLQRRLKVGYSRAARLVDELEAAGVVGPFDGSKAREVLVESEGDLEHILGSGP
jgi:S-DNA-T family DNA segregation ATPase FtsK/SpoIIIE